MPGAFEAFSLSGWHSGRVGEQGAIAGKRNARGTKRQAHRSPASSEMAGGH